MSPDTPRGRPIRIFLVDGVPSGIMTLELGNWTGKALAAPRTRLPDLVKRPEAAKTGVYVLVGPDPDEPTRQLAYIGQCDVIERRLKEHARSDTKSFFTRVCFFTSNDQNLNSAHARFLESRLIAAVKAANRAKLVNDKEPEFAALSEADLHEMETFLDHIGILLPLAGFDILRPIETTTGNVGARAVTFVCTIRGAEARMVERAGEYVVLTGSLLPADEVPTCPEYARRRRAELKADSTLLLDGARLRLTRDVAFATPSGASSFVGGRSDNGWNTWREQASGQSYKDWSAAQVAPVEGE